MKRHARLLAWSILAVVGCGTSSERLAVRSVDKLDPAVGVPIDLRDTGLYSDFDSYAVAPENQAYSPGFTLFSDGANKSRWVHLPDGARIDVSSMDEWVFPVGTVFWKEFRVDVRARDGSLRADQRIETRMIWKRSKDNWEMVSYVWSEDQRSATVADDINNPPPLPFPGTDSYEVPVDRCHKCHDLRGDRVLGFEAVLLGAPEAAPFGTTWSTLRSEDRVFSKGRLPDEYGLQFLGGANTVERAAAGYLHANCGITCHHANSGEQTPFFMRLEWAANQRMPGRIEETPLFQTAINVRSKFTPQGQGGTFYRIRPTDVTRSMVDYRMHKRNGLLTGGEQMPPIDSHKIDVAGCRIVDTWIQSMSAAPYPFPAP